MQAVSSYLGAIPPFSCSITSLILICSPKPPDLRNNISGVLHPIFIVGPQPNTHDLELSVFQGTIRAFQTAITGYTVAHPWTDMLRNLTSPHPTPQNQ